MNVENLLLESRTRELTKEELLFLINVENPDELKKIYDEAYRVKAGVIGNKVYFRGIVEFTNICVKNCDYCGIRKDNTEVPRFMMTKEEIMESVMWAHRNKYGSIVLQSGERTDAAYVDFVEEVIKEVKSATNNEVGITLSLGEQTRETYERWFRAGAHRYLLRVETSNPELYAKIHPMDHSHKARVECIRTLRDIGYQTGTGVMIGLPYQTNEDLVNDIIFFKENDVHMIGMGPYVVSSNTPLGKNAVDTKEERKRRFELGIKMIALTRIYLKDVNIAATTALQALNPVGRELGLKAGANILMPIITDIKHRKNYQLYDNKPCIDDNADECKNCLENRIKSVGDEIGYGQWGDSLHGKI